MSGLEGQMIGYGGTFMLKEGARFNCQSRQSTTDRVPLHPHGLLLCLEGNVASLKPLKHFRNGDVSCLLFVPQVRATHCSERKMVDGGSFSP